MQRFADAETNADWYGRYSPQQEAAEAHSPPRQTNHNHAQVAACYLPRSGPPPDTQTHIPSAVQAWRGRANAPWLPSMGITPQSYAEYSLLQVCTTAIVTNGTAHPPTDDTVVYHFPMHPRAVMTVDKARRQHLTECVRPDWDTQPGTITPYDWKYSRQELMQGPTRENGFKEENSLPCRSDKQLKEIYAHGFHLLKMDDYVNGQPLGLYGKGHAWPLNPLKLAKASKGDYLGSQRLTARPPESALVFIPPADQKVASSLNFTSIAMPTMCPPKRPRRKSLPMDATEQSQHLGKAAAVRVPHAHPKAEWHAPDDPMIHSAASWAEQELLHDIALHGDHQLRCVPDHQADIESSHPGSTVGTSASTLMAKDPGGGTLDPWEDTNLLRCLRGTPVHEVDSSTVERQRIAGRLSAYSLESPDDRVDKIERLYRHVLDGTKREVPPPGERLGLVRQVHIQAMHLGVRRTQQLTMRRWYWYTLRQDVRLVIRTCEECARRNIAFHSDDPELHCLVIMELCYRWSCDLCKLPESKHGYVRCMICVEHLSRFVIIIPLKAKKAFDTALAFRLHVIGVFGLMAEVLTDQGKEFAA